MGMVQSSASHHTGNKTIDPDLSTRMQKLEKEVSTLTELVRNMVSSASEPHIVRVDIATGTTQPNVVKKVQFQEVTPMEVDRDNSVGLQPQDAKTQAADAVDEEVKDRRGARPAPAEQPPAAVQPSSASSSLRPEREIAQEEEVEEVIPAGFPRTAAEHFEPTPSRGLPQVPDALIRACAQRLYDSDEKKHHILLGDMVSDFVGDYAEESITRGLQRARDLAAQWHWGSGRWRPWCEPERWPSSTRKTKRPPTWR